MRPFCALIPILPVIILNLLQMGPCSGQKRVINGKEVQNDDLDDWKFLVALFRWEVREGVLSVFGVHRFCCGGAILNSWQILTAAHCILKPNKPRFVVVPGLNYTKEFIGNFGDLKDIKGYPVQHIVNHDFDQYTLENDIAILTLTEPLDLSKYSYIDLEPYNYHPESNESCLLAGWGRQDHNRTYGGPPPKRRLRKINLPIMDLEKCNETYKTAIEEGVVLTDSHICAGSGLFMIQHEEACKGDSGGPLVCKSPDSNKPMLVGITSWVRCFSHKPTVFTHVSPYRAWIDKNLIDNQEISDKAATSSSNQLQYCEIIVTLWVMFYTETSRF